MGKQMTALRFQTGVSHQVSLASLQERLDGEISNSKGCVARRLPKVWYLALVCHGCVGYVYIGHGCVGYVCVCRQWHEGREGGERERQADIKTGANKSIVVYLLVSLLFSF